MVLSLFFIPLQAVQALNADLEQDTYGLSMGSAVAAIAAGTHAIQWNPAGIARVSVPMAQLGLGFNPGNDQILFNTGVLYPFNDGTVFALSQFSDFPSLPGSQTTYIGSVALPLNASHDFFFGLNLKYLALSTQVGPALENGRGLGLDFGLSYDLRRPSGTIASFALAVKDADTQIRFDNNDEQSVTRTFVLGAAYQNIPDTRFEADYAIVDQTLQNSTLHNRLRLGAERFFGNRFYSVRVGFDDLFNTEGYFSMGAGYHPDQPFEISYAFRANVNTTQFSHFLSFIYRFDNWGKNEPAPERVVSKTSSEINIGEGAELTAPPSGKPISAIPLRKMSIQADPPIFSPTGKQKSATISFPEGNIPDVARWLVEIQNSKKAAVRRIGGTGALMPMLVWDGMNEEGKQVQDGKYQIVLKTFNRKNEILSNDFEPVEILSTRAHFEIQTTGRYFSTRPGKKRRTDILFTVNAGGSTEVQNWDFEISDSSTNKVVYESQGTKKLPKTLKWSGNNLNQEAVPEGDYLCLLIAQDKAGNSLKTDALKITINNTPPDLTLKGEDNLVDFNTKKTFRFFLQSADKVGIDNWKVEISNEKDDILKSFEGKGQPPRELVWDGNTDQMKPVEQGSLLEAAFSASDRAGNGATTDPISFQVDYQPPTAGEQMTLNLTTLYFDALSSTLTVESKKELEKAAASIKPYLNKSILVVKGFAAPDEGGNLLVLSHGRALEVKKYLTKMMGVSPNTIFVVGYSARETSKSGATPGQKESQRKAVISLTTQP